MQKNAVNPIGAVKSLLRLGKSVSPSVAENAARVGRSASSTFSSAADSGSKNIFSRMTDSPAYNSPVTKLLTDLALPGYAGYGSYNYLTESQGMDPVSAGLYSLGAASIASPRDYINAAANVQGGKGSGAWASQYLKNITPQVKNKAMFTSLASIPMVYNIIKDLGATASKARQSSEQLAATDPGTGKSPAEALNEALSTTAGNIQASGKIITEQLKELTKARQDAAGNLVSPSESLGKGLVDLGDVGGNLKTLTGENNPLARLANSTEKLVGLAESGKNFLKNQNPAYVGAGLGAAAGIPLVYLAYRALQRRKNSNSKKEKAASFSSIDKTVADPLMPPPGTRPNNLTLYGAPLAVLAARAAMGAGIGAGANYIGDYLLPDPSETDEQRQNRLKRSLIVGTGVGLGSGAMHAADLYGELKGLQNAPSMQAIELQKHAKAQINKLGQAASRCWTGYEPVPGKTPYSEDSCRPVGSKPKKKEKKAKSDWHEYAEMTKDVDPEFQDSRQEMINWLKETSGKRRKKVAGCGCSADKKCDNCGNAPCECGSNLDVTRLAKLAVDSLKYPTSFYPQKSDLFFDMAMQDFYDKSPSPWFKSDISSRRVPARYFGKPIPPKPPSTPIPYVGKVPYSYFLDSIDNAVHDKNWQQIDNPSFTPVLADPSNVKNKDYSLARSFMTPRAVLSGKALKTNNPFAGK